MAYTPPPISNPASQWGTLGIVDMLATKNTAIINYGIQDIELFAQEYLDAHNELLKEQVDFFVEDTTVRIKGVGGAAPMRMIRNNEFGTVNVQKVAGAASLGFPLERWDIATQWTWDFFQKATPHDLAQQIINKASADKRQFAAEIRRALFTPTNSTYIDENVDMMAIPVKALANADGFPIPPNPNGKTFNPATHTHYMGTAGTTLAGTDVDALLGNVVEHFNSGRLVLFLNSVDESFMSANPSQFPKYQKMVYTKQVPGILNTHMEGTLDVSNTLDRMTGTYQDAEVWVKPWVPAGFLVCLMIDTEKPLARRTQESLNSNVSPGDFRLIYKSVNSFPLDCDVMRREHGFAPQNRVAAACMSIGSSVYTVPASFFNNSY